MRKKYTKPYLEVYKIDVTLLLQETSNPGGDEEYEDPGAIPWSFTKPSSSAFKTRTSSTEETSSSDGGFGSGNNSPF